MDRERPSQFEKRKQDHIELALRPENEAAGFSGFEKIQLIHEALPELDFEDIQLKTNLLGVEVPTPLMVSSMTAGHMESLNLNERLAVACEQRGWLMGVGSQRRELHDAEACKEWQALRKIAPKVRLLGNLGLSQIIRTETADVERLVDALEATAMIVHTNPLQECLQPEGTPHFRGGIEALQRLCSELSVPVILKETGCGFSKKSLERLSGIGLTAVDVSGYGGTHWGRIEGERSRSEAAKSFSGWGISTVDSLINAGEVGSDYEVWASGGIRTGVDVAKALALGAQCVGLAKPLLEVALESEENLHNKMATIEYELRTTLFCTGCQNLDELKSKGTWQWQTI